MGHTFMGMNLARADSLTRFDVAAMLGLWAITPIAYLALGQDSSWDLKNYHLYNSISFLGNSFSADTAPAGIQSYLNPLVSLPAFFIHYASANAHQALLSGLALSVFQGLIGPLTYWISSFFWAGSPFITLLAALFGVTSPIVIGEAGTTWADLSLAVLQLFPIALVIRALTLRSHRTIRLLMTLAWGIYGAGCGLKFTGILILPLLLLLTLHVLLTAPSISGGPFRRIFLIFLPCCILPFCFGFLFFAAPWMIRGWQDHSNPFFPLFSSIFGKSPIFDVASNDIDTRFFSRDLRGLVTAAKDEFSTKPRRLEYPYTDLRPSLWLYTTILALGTSTLVMISRAAAGLRIALFSANPPLSLLLTFQWGMVITYFAWLWLAGIARYTIAVQCLSGIAFAGSILILWQIPNLQRWQQLTKSVFSINEKSPNTRYKTLISTILLATLVLCLLTQVIPPFERVPFSAKWNSLRLVPHSVPEGKASAKPSHAFIFSANINPFADGQPIVLLRQPLGWVKQYSSPNQSVHLLNSSVPFRPQVIEQLLDRLRTNGGSFNIVDNRESSVLKEGISMKLANGVASFLVLSCTDYTNPFETLAIRVCNASLK